MVFIRRAALILGSVSVFACSSSEAPETARGGAPTCELHDGGCGEGCCSQPGNRYDPTRDCIEREQVIGCAPGPASTSACKLFGIVGCFVTPEGTFHTPGLAPGWTGGTGRCDDALREKVTSAKPCPTADAGAD